jgi:hypothetical protein
MTVALIGFALLLLLIASRGSRIPHQYTQL